MTARLLRWTVVAALLAALTPAAASAWRPSARSHRLASAVAVANAYWGTPCPVATWREIPFGVGGMAWPATCEWGLATDWIVWQWPILCAVVVHEFGHLAGRDHNDDPASVMSGAGVLAQPAICGKRPRRNVATAIRPAPAR